MKPRRPDSSVPLPTSRRVLVVTEDSAQRGWLAMQLADAGYAVEMAANAEAVLAMPPDEVSQMILCDRVLRRGSGADLCAALRQRMGDRYAYFLLLGGWDDEDQVQAALAGGVDDILPHPLPEAKLRLRLAAGARILDMAGRLMRANSTMATTLERLREAQKALDRDLAEARRLQQGLVRERFQQFGAVSLSLLLRPAGHIGGDLVGSFPIDAARIGLFAIDVSGHGVAAALTAARLSAHLSGELVRGAATKIGVAPSPVEVVRHLNRMMLDDTTTDSYFTMIFVELDVTTGQGHLVQAGHPNPLLQAADGSVRMLGHGGLPVGLVEDADYDSVPFAIAPGERLFIASDGLTEASGPRGDLLGDEGLQAAMLMNARLGGQTFLESLCWSVNLFTQGVQTDDISAILIEHGGKP